MTVGVVCVAQGIAYGLLAGLPSYYGLYASLVPSLVYAAFVSLHKASTKLACTPDGRTRALHMPGIGSTR